LKTARHHARSRKFLPLSGVGLSALPGRPAFGSAHFSGESDGAGFLRIESEDLRTALSNPSRSGQRHFDGLHSGLHHGANDQLVSEDSIAGQRMMPTAMARPCGLTDVAKVIDGRGKMPSRLPEANRDPEVLLNIQRQTGAKHMRSSTG